MNIAFLIGRIIFAAFWLGGQTAEVCVITAWAGMPSVVENSRPNGESWANPCTPKSRPSCVTFLRRSIVSV